MNSLYQSSSNIFKNQLVQLSPYRRDNFDVKIENKEKDILISQLKAHIFEMQQREKDFDNMKEEFCQLQNEYTCLNDNKIRIECELKEKEDCYNKQISDLTCDNDNLKINLNEKISLCKKLYDDIENLSKNISIKDCEIEDLNNKLNDLYCQNDVLKVNKCEMEKAIRELNEIKSKQKLENSKLIEDNKKLSKICQEQSRNLKVNEEEKNQLIKNLDESSFNLNNVKVKLQKNEDNFNYLKNKFDELKNINSNLENTLLNYERKINSFQNENESLKSNLNREKMIRNENEKKIEKISDLINSREYELTQITNDLEKSKNINKLLLDDKTRIQIENEKLKQHIMVLTNENQKLVCEFENIIDEDEKLKQQLGRKDKIVQILRNNKNNIEQSLSSLEGHINNNNQNINMNIIHNHNKVKDKIYHQKQKFRAISPPNNIRPYSSNNSPNTYNRSQLSYSDEY
jgi:chromosome segregation ATPase